MTDICHVFREESVGDSNLSSDASSSLKIQECPETQQVQTEDTSSSLIEITKQALDSICNNSKEKRLQSSETMVLNMSETSENAEAVGKPDQLEGPMDTETVSETSDKAALPTTLQDSITLKNIDDSKANDSDKQCREKQCYCGKERDFGTVELQCGGCLKWFHECCITCQIGKCVPFMTNYSFMCKECNATKVESFTKKQANFSQMSATAIANLSHQSKLQNSGRTLFSKDKEIIPFIEKNWEHLTTMPRRVKQTWHNTVLKSMLKDSEIFVCEERGLNTDPMFGLATQDLQKIGPNYEGLVRSSQSKPSDLQSTQFGENARSVSFGKGRAAKRKIPGDSQSTASSKKARSDLTMPKLPPHGYPLEHPFNKDGYRYILAEPDPHAPFRQEFDESPDWAGKPIPGWLYRKLVPNSIYMALHDRAPQIKLSDDRLSVTGDKGYCMIRATHGISYGTWYFECTVEDMPENSATRLGWSQELGNLQAPLGYDRFSYSWRSRKGTRFHQSCGFHYSDEGYGQGDTVGFLIHLPNYKDYTPLPPTYKDKPLIKFKSYLYFEEKDEVQEAIEKLKPLPNSKIIFYKNGQPKGVAWKDINEGTYYPAVSLYKSCTVHVNFGPNFKYPPKGVDFKPMYIAGHEALIEQTMADILYLTENEGKLRLPPNLEVKPAETEGVVERPWKRAFNPLLETIRNKRLGKA